MQVTEVANEGLKRAYTVVVPATSIAAQKDKRLAELAKDMKMPGFRPGKVPQKVVLARYGQAVMGEVLEASVQEATSKVVTDNNLRPALQPKIELVNFADGADLEFRMDVEVLPTIPMPDFASISLTRLKAAPGDEEVAKALESISRRQASLEETEARAAAKGEVLVCDFVGRIGGEEFQGGSATDMPIEVAGPGFIPGFTEQLEGLAPGEQRIVKVTFPAEYGSAELAGKDAEFTVTAKALKVYSKPALDDELAKKLGLESFEKLREVILESLQREYDSQSRMAIKRKLLDALAERASFEVPEGMVENEFKQIWERVEADMKAGRLDGEDAGKDEATLKAEYRGIAERRIRLGLLLSEIGTTNNITVSREELGNAMRAEVQRYPGQEKQVFEFFQKNPQALENLRSPIFEEKVVDFMLELAKVEDETVTPEKLAEAATQI
ncbi:trigger factor [Roseococcus sp. SDR]|uniref:trigger factor n=1 Tax=Roseococcus sp. SDR TaxID=2835532 RepID=UPI001BCCB02A|nr:trigger factor [Roseococcus sp. SDR]MBS7790535.1 trigger factor [Roseococcus sp. SDR]MBV1845849.1 trigger factor [Roseococcus sp. SDR]